MEKILLVAFRSELSAGVPVEAIHRDLIGGLRECFEVEVCAPGEEAGKEGLVIAFIASGGSERAFMAYREHLPDPVLLLADGAANSLPASLEILAWLREAGARGEILHGEAASLRARIGEAMAADAARKRIGSARLGMVGMPSDWLIASSVDPVAARSRWGVEFVGVELAELDGRIDAADEAEARRAAEFFIAGATALREAGEADIISSARIYLALKRLAAELKLDALTLKCFDLLESRRSTGCMALALLNQEGIPAACEGDQRSAFTMLLARALSGGPSFMANPALVDVAGKKAIFAHCTIAPCLAGSYALRSHFESGLGVGVQGILEAGPVTLFKIGGPALDRYFLSSGRVLRNLDDPLRCRTQVEVSLDEDPAYFLRSPLSNHHILLPGDHVARFSAFLDGEGLERNR